MISSVMYSVSAAVVTGTLAASAAVAQEYPRRSEHAPEFRLTGDVVSIPFAMVGEFPFVEAEINGVRGKLMLDTGALDALSLNHNHIELPAGRVIGQGKFGSGQTYELILRPSVRNVRLASGPTYRHVTTVHSQDAAQLEQITPDFLGWLGYSFWDGYSVKFDYKLLKATFYKGGPEAFLKGETIVAAIPFDTPKLPNNPVMMTRIGDSKFSTIIDTGQYGGIYADKITFDRLKSAGAIKPAIGEENPLDVSELFFSDGPAISLAKLPSYPIEDSAPFAKSIGVSPPRIMTLGYALLHQYKTVWDYPNKTLYLLKS